MKDLDYYALLGIAPTADADTVRAAFHAFARRHHPDRWAHGPEAERQESDRLYRHATEAYRVLMDPAERRRYDEGLGRGEVRLGPPGERASRPPTGEALALRSTRARPFVLKAREAANEGNLRAAKLNLTLALNADPGNAAIEAMLKELASR